MSRRRVVVTGMGVVAANGVGCRDFADALRSARSGIAHIARMRELGFGSHVGGIPDRARVAEVFERDIPESRRVAMDSGMIYGLLAAREAWQEAGLEVPSPMGDDVHDETGAIIATGMGGLDAYTHKVIPSLLEGKGTRRLGSTMAEQVMVSSVSAVIGGHFALGAGVMTNSSACCSGTEAVIEGLERIRSGRARRMIVGGAESSCVEGWSGFDAMRVLSRAFNDTPEKASRPMSATAAGFVPSSGAGMLILEDLELALTRRAPIFAEVVGGATTCGGQRRGGSMTAPSPDGVRRCVRQALLDGGVRPREIDYINGHLTSTMGDVLEMRSWSAALEIPMGRLPWVNSTKSMIGHGLGAAGAIECVATLLQMRESFLHPSLNCEDLHPELAEIEGRIVRQKTDMSVRVAAKAGFGFGDVNACVIFKKWE